MDGDDGLGYGDDLPQVDEEEDQGDSGVPDGDEEGSKKLQEMEEELAKLKAMQEKVKMEVSSGQETGTTAGAVQSIEAREEVDGRSIYVGNVDYAVSPEQLQQHFQGCGTVNRVTILADKFGNPKGFAYVEFADSDAIGNALLLNESELNNRKLKVQAKRTNVPGMKQRAPHRGRGRGARGGAGVPMMYGFAPYVLPGVGGYMPYMGGRRGRGRRYSPYQ